jgi:signal transduction histidine kinase
VLLVVTYYIFRTTRTMEQNRIWVGLAKETAHQLGTPLSSLSGWTQYLRGKEFSEEYATEVEKDIHRLETITHRFSKIGSVPELKEENVADVVGAAIEYLRSRAPRKVQFAVSFPEDEQFIAPLNSYLFQWVIENLCKNAVDAMESGQGKIDLWLLEEGNTVAIEVADNGKGIKKKDVGNVFRPGFTTKKRGWGLGLSLAKRIVEEYHKGHIYVKSSELGKGTTFRIELECSRA